MMAALQCLQVKDGPSPGEPPHKRQDKLEIVGNEGILHGGNMSPSRP